jgi:hypothetical protein
MSSMVNGSKRDWSHSPRGTSNHTLICERVAAGRGGNYEPVVSLSKPPIVEAMASAEQQRPRPAVDPSPMDGDPASLDKVVTPGTGSGSDPTGAAGSASAACGTREGPSKGNSDVAAAADEGERGEDASSPEPSDDESGDSDAEEELIKEEKARAPIPSLNPSKYSLASGVCAYPC